MSTTWALEDLDLTKAIEVIPSQDPNTSLRFQLPIPNWLNENGEPKFTHEKIRFVEGKNGKPGSWRFFFKNYKDNCDQDVRIDGSTTITFMNVPPQKTEQLIQLVNEYVSNPDDLSPEQLEDILERSRVELELNDRFNSNRSGVASFMHPYLKTDYEFFGAFLPNKDVSTAVYVQGAGTFQDGPTATPQTFSNGAFISFPGQKKENVLKMSPQDIRASDKFKVRLVQADVFIASRSFPDETEIHQESLPLQNISAIEPETNAATPELSKH